MLCFSPVATLIMSKYLGSIITERERERGGGRERECIPEKSYIVHCSGVYGEWKVISDHIVALLQPQIRGRGEGERKERGWSEEAEEISCKIRVLSCPVATHSQGLWDVFYISGISMLLTVRRTTIGSLLVLRSTS